MNSVSGISIGFTFLPSIASSNVIQHRRLPVSASSFLNAIRKRMNQVGAAHVSQVGIDHAVTS